MLISTRGRYALRILVDMAEHNYEGGVKLKDAAGRQGVSEKYMESIVRSLVECGILTGARGILRKESVSERLTQCQASMCAPRRRRTQVLLIPSSVSSTSKVASYSWNIPFIEQLTVTQFLHMHIFKTLMFL